MKVILATEMLPANYLKREQVYISEDEITMLIPKDSFIDIDWKKPIMLTIEQ